MPQLFTGIGIMSGTSLDGIDIALCHFWKQNDIWKYDIEAAETFLYDIEWRSRLLKLTNSTAYDLAKTNIDYAHYIGFKLRNFVIVTNKEFDFVASHGHTIFHQPERHFTTQIGDGETLATYLTCPLITNFRNKDVALGGQGAPLAPVGERELFPNVSLFLNLGGIANLSILPRENTQFKLTTWKKGADAYLAYDICACNMVLNYLAARQNPQLLYDEDGKIAQQGKLIPELLKIWENLPYYELHPPRTLGREWVEENIFTTLSPDFSPKDLLYTYCTHIANRIKYEIERFELFNTPILITGGGALNIFLMNLLVKELSPLGVNLVSTDHKIIAYKEALIFAFLGLHTLLGLENTIRSVTGAKHSIVSGSIHLPAYNERHSGALRAFMNKQILSSN